MCSSDLSSPVLLLVVTPSHGSIYGRELLPRQKGWQECYMGLAGFVRGRGPLIGRSRYLYILWLTLWGPTFG